MISSDQFFIYVCENCGLFKHENYCKMCDSKKVKFRKIQEISKYQLGLWSKASIRMQTIISRTLVHEYKTENTIIRYLAKKI